MVYIYIYIYDIDIDDVWMTYSGQDFDNFVFFFNRRPVASLWKSLMLSDGC